MAQGQGSEDIELLYIEIRRRLIESGEWDRVRTILSTWLAESGWMDEMNEKAEGHARAIEAPTVESIFIELHTDAQKSLPPNVKSRIDDVISDELGKLLA